MEIDGDDDWPATGMSAAARAEWLNVHSLSDTLRPVCCGVLCALTLVADSATAIAASCADDCRRLGSHEAVTTGAHPIETSASGADDSGTDMDACANVRDGDCDAESICRFAFDVLPSNVLNG